MTDFPAPLSDADLIVPLNPSGAAAPLVCVHASAGSAYPYLPLAQLLGADQPVLGIEAPGFDGEQAPVSSVPDLSARYAAALREAVPGGAVHLLGWSLGGLITFDMARRLAGAGVEVGRVFLVDSSPPHPYPMPPESETAGRFLHDIAASLGLGDLRVEIDALVAGRDGGTDAFFREVQHLGAWPSELDARLLGERYAVFHAHTLAAHTYEPPGRYDGPVWHLLASKSPPQDGRWAELAPDLTEHTVPGDHHSIWYGDSLRRLAALIRSALAGSVPGGETEAHRNSTFQ
ncbi:alpha/beta fold hydrolase [Streptomyces sp. SID8352]|uniref:thioesterase domain-containing protein n=1 Tax=Streptomyces sp. SID8352 TaxID=2690338 RepID=UPI00136BE038|nr:alpha/beta fold hydrolase [Streptomyces sp. SID8352]MYU24124.1 alpha/beta fold hydrolase [Streptomyces sp. SID8352]